MSEPLADPDMSYSTYADQRDARLTREMHRMRVQMVFLFAFLVVALALASIRAQLNADRIELERWQSCQDRIVAVMAYNSHLPPSAAQFPVPQCGADPRTD